MGMRVFRPDMLNNFQEALLQRQCATIEDSKVDAVAALPSELIMIIAQYAVPNDLEPEQWAQLVDYAFDFNAAKPDAKQQLVEELIQEFIQRVRVSCASSSHESSA